MHRAAAHRSEHPAQYGVLKRYQISPFLWMFNEEVTLLL